MEGAQTSFPPEARQYVHRFRTSVPLRAKLHEVLRALGPTDGETCLDIGSGNGMLNYHLRRRGGAWYSVVTSDEADQAVRPLVNENVYLVKDRSIPFSKKKIFDAIVIFDYLTGGPEDEPFIEECHRMLKPDGRLVVTVAHFKALSPIRRLRRLLKVGDEAGAVRAGYTESRLFGVLKHGFDVHTVRSYSRFCVELVDALVRFFEKRMRRNAAPTEARIMRFCSLAAPFYWLANQLDLFLFFTRGHCLMASAKRRAWRPRRAPVLVDGRSISEVVLSKAAD
jgi:SAM-dependent methyltransferase